jgi:hypothetical protein
MKRKPRPTIGCVYCQGRWLTRSGRHQNGRPRYKCQDCGRTFVDPALRTKRIPPDVTPSQLILKLKALAERLGHTPAASEVDREFKKGFPFKVNDYVRAFGSYSAATKKAGLIRNYRRIFNEQEKEFMLDQLRALSRRYRRPVTAEEVRLARSRGVAVSPVTHYQKAFGSVAKALAAAGVAVKRKYTDDELISILRKLDLKLEHPVMRADINRLAREGKCMTSDRIAQRFGSLKQARQRCGIRQPR